MKRLGLTEGRRRLQESKYFDTDAMYQDYPEGFRAGRVVVKPSHTDGGIIVNDKAFAIGTRVWTEITSSWDGRVVATIHASDLTEGSVGDLIAELKKCQKEMAEINSVIRKYQL